MRHVHGFMAMALATDSFPAQRDQNRKSPASHQAYDAQVPANMTQPCSLRAHLPLCRNEKRNQAPNVIPNLLPMRNWSEIDRRKGNADCSTRDRS